MPSHTPVNICPDDHAHAATLNCFIGHRCRCPECVTGQREYAYYRRHMIAAGRGHVFNSLLDARGARRRIQALMCLGWSQSEIARRAGMRQARLSAHLHLPHVKRSSYERVCRIYDELSHLIPPTDTTPQRMSVNRTRALARRNGWAPPMAWDDIDHDEHPAEAPKTKEADPVAVDLAISGHQVRLTPADRRACVQLLHEQRWSDGRIAERIHCDVKTVERIRHELHLPAHPVADIVARNAA